MWSIAEPSRLWLVGLAAFAIVGGWLLERRLHAVTAGKLGERGVLGRMLASASPRRRALKMVLTMAAATLLVIAVAEPQRASTDQEEQRGLDLVIAMDVSKSMLVTDVAPDRLARARELALQTLDGLPGDRSAAVVFANGAAHFPLTADHEVTAHFLQDLGPADLPPGSNLAEALRSSRCILRRDVGTDLGCADLDRRGHGGDPLPGERDDERDEEVVIESEERGRAIVVFTDGGDPDDETRHEVALARDLGIAVYIVGVGTEAGGEVWDIDDDGRRTRVKHDAAGKPIISTRNDKGLRELCEIGGDGTRYMVGTEQGPPDASALVASLTTLQRGVVKQTVRRRHGMQLYWLFPGFILLLIESAISTRRRVASPDGTAAQLAAAHARVSRRQRRREARERRDDDDGVPLGPSWSPAKLGWTVGLGGYVATLLFLVLYHQVGNRTHHGFTGGETVAALVMLGVCIAAGIGVARWQRQARVA